MAWTRGGRELEMALKRVDGFGIDSEGEANSLAARMEIGSERKGRSKMIVDLFSFSSGTGYIAV